MNLSDDNKSSKSNEPGLNANPQFKVNINVWFEKR